MLVFLMTPGLAFFYGGLARRKNVVNTMLMCLAVVGVVGVLWVVAGWSLAYGGDGSLSFIGGLDQLLPCRPSPTCSPRRPPRRRTRPIPPWWTSPSRWPSP